MSTTVEMDPAIARAVQAFNDQDADGYVAEFAPDGTFTDPVEEELDTAELRAYINEFFEAFPDAHMDPDRVMSSDHETAVEWTFQGTHEGEFAGVPATGETVDEPFVSIIVVSDDGITSWTDYWDRIWFAEAVGAA